MARRSSPSWIGADRDEVGLVMLRSPKPLPVGPPGNQRTSAISTRRKNTTTVAAVLTDQDRSHGRLVVRLLNLVAKSISKVSTTVVGGETDQCLTVTFTASTAFGLLASSIT